MPPNKLHKVAYIIVERDGRKYWLRAGIAFVNRDGSLNVRLDAIPLSGQLHIRDEAIKPLPGGTSEPSADIALDAASTERKNRP